MCWRTRICIQVTVPLKDALWLTLWIWLSLCLSTKHTPTQIARPHDILAFLGNDHLSFLSLFSGALVLCIEKKLVRFRMQYAMSNPPMLLFWC